MTSMSPARLELSKDPRLRDPRLRDPQKQPEVEKPREIISEWQGVLLMADKRNTKISRIAKISCSPAPPVPLPERVQVDRTFIELKDGPLQICIGLPFFELHKTNYIYHRDSEWCKFLDFMYVSQKFATILCEGWELYVRPPQVSPPNGFSSICVHYRRMTEIPLAEAPMILPPTVPTKQGPASSFQVQASYPTPSNGEMEIESRLVLKQTVDPTAKLLHQSKVKMESHAVPNLVTDPTAKLSRQSIVNQPRVEGVLHGFHVNTEEDPAPSFQVQASYPSPSNSEMEMESQAVPKQAIDPTAKLSLQPKVFDPTAKLSLQPKVFDPTAKLSLQPKVFDPTAKLSYQPKVKRLRVEGEFQGFYGNTGTTAPTSSEQDLQELMLKAKEKFKSVANSVNDVSYDISPTVDCMLKPSLANGNDNTWGSHVADKGKIGASNGGTFEVQVPKPSSDGNGNRGKGATLGVAFVNEDWRKKYIANARVSKAQSFGTDSGPVEKLSQASAEAAESTTQSFVSDNGAVEKLTQASGSLQAVLKGMKEKVPRPKAPSHGNNNGAVKRRSQAFESIQGVPNRLTKRVSKRSSYGNGNIQKPRVVLCLPKVPEKFRERTTHVSAAVSMKEQMPKAPSSANDAFQKQTCLQSEASLHELLLSSSIDNFVEQKSSEEVVKQKDAPLRSSDSDSQQTDKFVSGVNRSEPQKIQLKERSTGGSLDGGNTTIKVVCQDPRFDVDEKRFKVVDQRQVSEVKDIPMDLPKIGESNNSKSMIKCSNCGQLQELPFDTEIDDFLGAWTCNMLPYIGSCRFQAEDIGMNMDDEVLSKHLNSTSCLDAHKPEDKSSYLEDENLELEDDDLELKDEDGEYEVERILDMKVESDGIKYLVKWVGYNFDDSTWEPVSHLQNARKKVEEYFIQHPLKQLEIKGNSSI